MADDKLSVSLPFNLGRLSFFVDMSCFILCITLLRQATHVICFSTTQIWFDDPEDTGQMIQNLETLTHRIKCADMGMGHLKGKHIYFILQYN